MNHINNKNINMDKKNKVQQFLQVFTKKFKERMNIKIKIYFILI